LEFRHGFNHKEQRAQRTEPDFIIFVFSAFSAVKSMAYAEVRQQYGQLPRLDQPYLCAAAVDNGRNNPAFYLPLHLEYVPIIIRK
jgi:hypothetical protein